MDGGVWERAAALFAQHSCRVQGENHDTVCNAHRPMPRG